MNCPKVYFAFDVSNNDCKECGEGKLYKACDMSTKENPHSACAGWAIWNRDTGEGGVYCCECYRKKQQEKLPVYEKGGTGNFI